jgi:hypothetical protein
MGFESVRIGSVRCELRKAAMLLAVALIAASISAVGAAGLPAQDEAPGPVDFLRTINTAEVTYGNIYHKGFSPALKNLGAPAAGQKPSAARSYLVDEDLAAGKKNDYIFTYKPSAPGKDGKINAYTVTARPVKWKKGLKSFFSDSSGVIRWTGRNRAPRASDPAIE